MSWETSNNNDANKKLSDAEEGLLDAIGGDTGVLKAFKDQHDRAQELLDNVLDRALDEQKNRKGKIRSDDSSWAGVAHVINQMHLMEHQATGEVDTPKIMKLVAMFLNEVTNDKTIKNTIEVINNGTKK